MHDIDTRTQHIKGGELLMRQGKVWPVKVIQNYKGLEDRRASALSCLRMLHIDCRRGSGLNGTWDTVTENMEWETFGSNTSSGL